MKVGWLVEKWNTTRNDLYELPRMMYNQSVGSLIFQFVATNADWWVQYEILNFISNKPWATAGKGSWKQLPVASHDDDEIITREKGNDAIIQWVGGQEEEWAAPS